MSVLEKLDEIRKKLDDMHSEIHDIRAEVILNKYQKWVPISTITGVHWMPKNTSRYFEKISLTPEGEKWIHDKPWEKFKAVKNRG